MSSCYTEQRLSEMEKKNLSFAFPKTQKSVALCDLALKKILVKAFSMHWHNLTVSRAFCCLAGSHQDIISPEGGLCMYWKVQRNNYLQLQQTYLRYTICTYGMVGLIAKNQPFDVFYSKFDQIIDICARKIRHSDSVNIKYQ